MAGISEHERSIQDQRGQVFDTMKTIMEKFDSGTDLTVEDRKTYDDAELRLQTLDADLKRSRTFRQIDEGKDLSAETRGVSRDNKDSAEKRYQDAYVSWFKGGVNGLTAEEREIFNGANTEYRAGAALGTVAAAGSDGSAGFLVPQGFWDNLQVALKAYGGLLNLANVIKTDSGAPMPWPTTDPTGQLGIYLTENTALNGSDLIEFGQGMMHAWFISSDVIKASYAILNDSAFDVDQFVTDRIGERIGRKIAAELHTGAGAVSSALTGLSTSLTAYAQTNTAGATPAIGGYYQPAAAEKAFWLGASGGSTAAATLAGGQISWGSVLGMIGTVDPAYRAMGRACFVLNDVVQQNIRQLTDGFGHPLWQPDLTVGPSSGPVARIEGFPVVVDQNAASVSTSGGTTGGLLFGDFKTALNVRMVNQAGTLRLTERYAEFLQVGYIGYVRLDSVPNDLRAVAQYKAGAS